MQVRAQVLTKSFYNRPSVSGPFFFFSRAPATARPAELPLLHAVIFPEELDRTALSGPPVFQRWEEFSTYQNAKQMLSSGVAQHSSEYRNNVRATFLFPQPERKKNGKKAHFVK